MVRLLQLTCHWGLTSSHQQDSYFQDEIRGSEAI